MIYLHYTDDGPAGPCGQDVRSTSPANDLLVFPDQEAMRAFLESLHSGSMSGRLRPSVTGIWREDEIREMKPKAS